MFMLSETSGMSIACFDFSPLPHLEKNTVAISFWLPSQAIDFQRVQGNVDMIIVQSTTRGDHIFRIFP